MRSEWIVWMGVWVWLWMPSLIHTHTLRKDPYLNPGTSDAVLTSLLQKDTHPQLSNHLAIEIHGGEELARALAKKYNLHYVSQVFNEPPVYHLHRPHNTTPHHHRARRSSTVFVQLLADEPGVKWVRQERAFNREKRHNINGLRPSSPFTTPDVGSRHSRNKIRQIYKNTILRQKEEEHGLTDDNSYLHRKTTTNRNLRGNIHINDKYFMNSLPFFPVNMTDKGKLQSSQRNFIAAMKNYEPDYNADSPYFNDPLFKDQWYLRNTGQLGHAGCDLNVTGAWHQGYTGKGVTICILDDGFQTTNADLAANYNPAVSYSLVRDGQPENDPSPRLDPPRYSNSHGTYCAGVVAAVANNGVCGVGVAYDANVGGVRIVDGKVTDIQEATALSRHADEVAVFSASWGPIDDGTHVEGPGKLAMKALLYGVTQGRRGLGTIYVWASGNGGVVYDNCNLDGYASSIYTLTVSALTDLGQSTFYSERCASTMAGVYVGGQHSLQAALGLKGRDKKVVVPELDGHCSNGFQGTSAAAPLMAGVVALVLQANPRLSWRDMQHLVAKEAAPTPAALMEQGWKTNASGKKFHPLQGFGAVNAGRMVEAARSWQNVRPQRTRNLIMIEGKSVLPRGWTNVTEELSLSSLMEAVEHVVATITLEHLERRLLNIYIASPSGTTSQVLTQRPNDMSTSGFHGWGFMSVHFWGEQPHGVWTIAIENNSNISGHLIKINLTVYGY